MTEAEEIVRCLADMDPVAECTLGRWCFLGEGVCEVDDYTGEVLRHAPECLYQRARDLCRAEALGV